MSHTLSSLINCPQLQADLDSHFTSCDPTKIRPFFEVGAWEFLTSPTNTNGMLQNKISPGNGKKLQTELLYTPRIQTSEVNASVNTPVCSSSNEAGMLSETYSIDCNENIEYNESFDICNLADICKDNGTWFTERIQAIMDVLIRRADKDVVGQMAALTGRFADGDNDLNGAGTEKTVMTKFADGTPDTNLFEEVTFSSENAAYCSIPYVLGWGELHKYMRRLQAGCCADSGLNIQEITRQQPLVFVSDRNIETTFAANHFIGMAAGALQVIMFNKFEGRNGINQVDTEHYKQTILRDPATGTPFDFVMKNDCGNIHVSLSLTFKLVGMPDDMFSVGDNLEGVTQVNEYVISNP